VRQLAGDLRVAPNTVVRACAELERGGWVELHAEIDRQARERPAYPPSPPPGVTSPVS
jgi:DNA-binding transcriptional regulator YhcF (GntR family)